MTIKNIGSKIISVGGTVLMPDASMKVNKAVCAAPAVKALAEMGMVAIFDEAVEAKAKAEADAKAKAEADAKAKAEADAKAKAEADAKAKAEAEKAAAQK